MNVLRPTNDLGSAIRKLTDELVTTVERLTFSNPVTHVYNPLIYARKGYDRYVHLYGNTTKPVLLVGMNPGPYGMAQTGVPFGDVAKVKEWLGICETVGQPANPHPKRPVTGFSCLRKEVSGSRLWGWAESRFGAPDAFFRRFFVLNYCPLVFMEKSGRNRTPNKLSAYERKKLFAVCDRALMQTLELLRPSWVVGIGGFAEQRVGAAAGKMGIKTGRITHPSPANPAANRGWQARIESELFTMGIAIPDINGDGTT